MPKTPLERLMFVQGSLCFFCKQPLSKADASVEHLFASANGGDNSDDNCVACCKAVNRLLGSMPLKDKFQVVLNQKGQFKCPNQTGKTPAGAPPPKAPVKSASHEHYEKVLEQLRKQGNSRPRKLATLHSSIVALLPKSTSALSVDTIVRRLQTDGVVTVTGTKVAYALK
jgi:hypothetical protein